MAHSPRQRSSILGLSTVALSLLLAGSPTVAQDVATFSTAEGQVIVATPAGPVPPGQPPTPHPGSPPGAQQGQPGQESKPGEGDKKKEGEGGDKKKEEPPTTVKRPEKPPRVPDPREFAVKLDDKGRVPAFNFIGQPWPDVLQWLANVSNCSLDWQELPNDYLNLTTQRPYTLDEVRDLINRHLNARGFTSIQSGEVLSVYKLDKLDPSLVRRVTEDQLYDLKPYDFVKVAFELPAGLEVDKAKEDVKQVLNPHAKVFPLVSSKRLLVMDSVSNLRTVSELLNQERMVQDGRVVPKEFVLKYARPDKVIDILYVVLGMDPKSRPTQMDLQLQQQKLQIMAQMQQRGTDVSKMLQKDGPPVYLAYNRQRNSVLANAPPEQMKIIEQTIAYLDVPFGNDGTSAAASTTTGDQRTMKKYPLTTLDPDQFVTTLEEIGGLSPSAEFKADDDSDTLFALATPADHERINGLIDQFDGSGRQFEVVWLRKLPADAVAASINHLMGSQNEKEEPRRRWWDWEYGGRDEDKKKGIKGFGVDADIEHNRLLLWANEAEMQRVRDLLVKLGEVPAGQRNARPVRIVAPADAQDTAAIIEKLRAAWPAGSNPLIIKTPPATTPGQPKNEKPAENPNPAPHAGAATDRATDTGRQARIAARFAQLDATAVPAMPAAETPRASPAKPDAPAVSQAPPITITITDDGRLMLSSSDTAALDRIEELIEQLLPPQKRFKVFKIQYVRAAEIWFDLTDYFKEDLEADSETTYDYFWYPPRPRSAKKDCEVSLSKRRKLMITYDRPSNSILVANASPSQLAEIQQLIDQFDQPSNKDSVEIRQTAAIKIQYSRPSIIAAAVKEVYRDLLSKRDKEFDHGDKREERSSTERMTVINYGGAADDENERPSPVKIGFDGALSLGADDVSGVLIVSAQKAIFGDIVRMVEELDNQAAPKTTVQVHHVNGNVSAQALQKAIDKAVGKAWLGQRPEQQPNQTGPDGDKKRGDKNRNNDRGDRQNDTGNDGNNE
jgi:type II secretory pathway component GspD/PulD (secretin)